MPIDPLPRVSVDLGLLWTSLARTGTPLPAAVRDAAIAFALQTKPASFGGLRALLAGMDDVSLDTAEKLTGWPAPHDPWLAAAYLNRPEHSLAELIRMVPRFLPTARRQLATSTRRPELLAHLAGTETDPDVLVAVAGNAQASDDVRLDVFVCLIDDLDAAERPGVLGELKQLTPEFAATLAERVSDLRALAFLVGAYRLGPAAHVRLADAIRAAVAALPLLERVLPDSSPISRAATMLAGARPDPVLCASLATDLDAAGVRFGPSVSTAVDPATWLTGQAPTTPAPAAPPLLTDLFWSTATDRARADAAAADELADLLDTRLGSNADAWTAFSTLAPGWDGTLGELLTACAGVGAPAA